MRGTVSPSSQKVFEISTIPNASQNWKGILENKSTFLRYKNHFWKTKGNFWIRKKQFQERKRHFWKIKGHFSKKRGHSVKERAILGIKGHFRKWKGMLTWGQWHLQPQTSLKFWTFKAKLNFQRFFYGYFFTMYQMSLPLKFPKTSPE